MSAEDYKKAEEIVLKLNELQLKPFQYAEVELQVLRCSSWWEVVSKREVKEVEFIHNLDSPVVEVVYSEGKWIVKSEYDEQ